MGLAADLDYRHRPANAAQRLVQAFGSSRPGAWLFSRTLRHLDTAVARVTRGRHSAPELLAGLPVLDLTTTGRKSGQPRTSHLISIPVGDDLALLGTNFGQPSHAGVGAQPRGRPARDGHLPRSHAARASPGRRPTPSGPR